MGRMPELQRRLIKLLSARQRRIPACVASSRFCRARIRQAPLSNQLWGISDRLRHPGHRIVFVLDTPPYRADSVPTVSMSVSPHCGMTGVTALLPVTPLFMAGSSTVDRYQDHAAPLAPDGLAVCAMAQMKPTSSRATAVIASGDFLPRAIRRR